ncbi:TPA: hypothetical protein ACLPEC_000073 [Klebsiella aerogenes]
MDIKEPTEQELRDFLKQKYIEEKLNEEFKGHADAKQRVIEKQKQNLKKISAEAFFKYLADKGVSRKCVACGSEKLSVPQAVEIATEKMPENFDELSTLEQGMLIDAMSSTYVQYVSFDGIDNPIGLTRSYYTVHCLNCGNLTLYRTKPVLNWFNALQEQSGGADE